MRAGDKAADLGSRREGTVPILESRPTAVVSWRRLREAEPPGRERSAPAAGAPASGGNAGRMNSWRFPYFGIFRSYFEVLSPACNITALYYKKVLLYEQRTL